MGTVNFDQPVFLLGSIRSGTTLLRLILDSHPSISFQHESEFLFEYVHQDGGFPTVEEFEAALRKNWVFRRSGLEFGNAPDFPSAVDYILRQKAIKDQKKIFGATVHHHYAAAFNLYPNSRLIHIVRDGRDVALSVRNMGVEGNVFHASNVWLRALEEWEEIQPKISQSQFIEVRFEDLVSEPTKVLSKICDFLEVPYSDDMLKYDQHSTYERPDQRAAFRWKKLNKSQLRPLESKLHKQLEKYGYEVNKVEDLVFYEHWWQSFDNRVQLLVFRTKRYGFIYFAFQVAKVFPFGSLKEKLLSAMLEIDLQYIK